VVNNTCSLSVLHGYKDAKPKKFWGHDLDFLGSRDVIMTTWPLDSACALSYWWSTMTMRLSCTVMEI